jgi:hypothetical protein
MLMVLLKINPVLAEFQLGSSGPFIFLAAAFCLRGLSSIGKTQQVLGESMNSLVARMAQNTVGIHSMVIGPSSIGI